jgi:hypothetical protein
MANDPAAAAAVADEIDAFTIEEFCRRNRISIGLFYKYPDDMPATFVIGKRRLISKEAAAEWRRRKEEETGAADY